MGVVGAASMGVPTLSASPGNFGASAGVPGEAGGLMREASPAEAMRGKITSKSLIPKCVKVTPGFTLNVTR